MRFLIFIIFILLALESGWSKSEGFEAVVTNYLVITNVVTNSVEITNFTTNFLEITNYFNVTNILTNFINTKAEVKGVKIQLGAFLNKKLAYEFAGRLKRMGIDTYCKEEYPYIRVYLDENVNIESYIKKLKKLKIKFFVIGG